MKFDYFHLIWQFNTSWKRSHSWNYMKTALIIRKKQSNMPPRSTKNRGAPNKISGFASGDVTWKMSSGMHCAGRVWRHCLLCTFCGYWLFSSQYSSNKLSPLSSSHRPTEVTIFPINFILSWGKFEFLLFLRGNYIFGDFFVRQFIEWWPIGNLFLSGFAFFHHQIHRINLLIFDIFSRQKPFWWVLYYLVVILTVTKFLTA